jgi:hypothetical protein
MKSSLKFLFLFCLFVAGEATAQTDQAKLKNGLGGLQVGVFSIQIFQERVISDTKLIKYECGVNYQFRNLEDIQPLAFFLIPEVGFTIRNYPNLLNKGVWIKTKENNIGNFIGVNIFNDIRKISFSNKYSSGPRSFINVLGEVGFRRILGKKVAIELSAAAGFRKQLYEPVFDDIAFIVNLKLNFLFIFMQGHSN